jgi:hypothetical protein
VPAMAKLASAVDVFTFVVFFSVLMVAILELLFSIVFLFNPDNKGTRIHTRTLQMSGR